MATGVATTTGAHGALGNEDGDSALITRAAAVCQDCLDLIVEGACHSPMQLLTLRQVSTGFLQAARAALASWAPGPRSATSTTKLCFSLSWPHDMPVITSRVVTVVSRRVGCFRDNDGFPQWFMPPVKLEDLAALLRPLPGDDTVDRQHRPDSDVDVDDGHDADDDADERGGTPLMTSLCGDADSLCRWSLSAVDLAGCHDAGDDLVTAIAERAPAVRRLGIGWCHRVTSVEAFGDAIEVLDARFTRLTDAGLQHATRLKTLIARGCPGVTTIAPFAETLEELDAAFDCLPGVGTLECGIGDAGLAYAPKLRVLNASENSIICTVAPFSATLEELNANSTTLSDCGLDDEGIAAATKLRVFTCSGNTRVKSVTPFAETLEVLEAAFAYCGLEDPALACVHKLRKLVCRHNSRITTVAPFAATLVELDASGLCGIGDDGLATAAHLIALNVGSNRRVTTTLPFAASLTELGASKACGITLAGLQPVAPRLRVLHVRQNTGITLPPRLDALEVIDVVPSATPFDQGEKLRKLKSPTSWIVPSVGVVNDHAVGA